MKSIRLSVCTEKLDSLQVDSRLNFRALHRRRRDRGRVDGGATMAGLVRLVALLDRLEQGVPPAERLPGRHDDADAEPAVPRRFVIIHAHRVALSNQVGAHADEPVFHDGWFQKLFGFF